MSGRENKSEPSVCLHERHFRFNGTKETESKMTGDASAKHKYEKAE
jgi:hypothetical protein